MTTAYVLFGALVLLAFVIVLLRIDAKREGRMEAEAEHNQRMAENAEAMGKVMSESRDPDGSGDSDRMRDGTF